MKQFDEWWTTQRIPFDIGPPWLEKNAETAFRAGMLAAADIAENDSPSPEGVLVADDIRKTVYE